MHDLPFADLCKYVLPILQQNTCFLIFNMHLEYFPLQSHFPLNCNWKQTLTLQKHGEKETHAPNPVTLMLPSGGTRNALSFDETTGAVTGKLCFDKLLL